MKSIIYKLILLLILFFPFKVEANEFVNFECVKENNEYLCEVYGIPEYSIRAIDFKYSLPTYVNNSAFTLDDNIIGKTDNNWVTALFEDLIDEKILIGTLKISTDQELNTEDIIISEVKVVNEYYEDVIISDNQNNNVNKKESWPWLLKIIISCGIILLGIMIFMIGRRKK